MLQRPSLFDDEENYMADKVYEVLRLLHFSYCSF